MKKQNKQTESLKKITIIFGYTLFVLLLVTVIISTVVPFGSLLLNPEVRHFNVAVIVVSLVAGAILPLLLSYMIGDKTTHSKLKVDHHFNGVLLGVASYWLSTFFYFIGSDAIANIRDQFPEPLATALSAWPILATVAVVAVVAAGYAKAQKKHLSLLDYKPYQCVLLAGLLAAFLYVLSNLYYSAYVYIVMLYVATPVILVGASYGLLPKKQYSSSASRFTGAVITVSFCFVASSIAAQLQLYPNTHMMIPTVVGAIVLALYLVLSRRP